MEKRILKDPVCGMTVTAQSFYHLEHVGQTHYFCGPKCKGRFAADALRYSGVAAAPAALPVDAPPKARPFGVRSAMLALAVLVTLLLAAYWLL
ncbi:MAG: YHS domain-containing protein [Rhodoferax sp.]|nr:YHS domain-containing protein [Rhodoferax sp.]